jgi:hypothetical protein
VPAYRRCDMISIDNINRKLLNNHRCTEVSADKPLTGVSLSPIQNGKFPFVLTNHMNNLRRNNRPRLSSQNRRYARNEIEDRN